MPAFECSHNGDRRKISQLITSVSHGSRVAGLLLLLTRDFPHEGYGTILQFVHVSSTSEMSSIQFFSLFCEEYGVRPARAVSSESTVHGHFARFADASASTPVAPQAPMPTPRRRPPVRPSINVTHVACDALFGTTRRRTRPCCL
jgi:hypothetical protein